METEVLDPATHLLPHRRDFYTRITPETAKKMQVLRAAKRAERLAEAKAQALAQAAHTPVTTQAALGLSDGERKELVGAYKELAAQSRAKLLSLNDAKDRHQEASTLAKLEACYWRYAGIPGEGTLKPAQDKPAYRMSLPAGPVD